MEKNPANETFVWTKVRAPRNENRFYQFGVDLALLDARLEEGEVDGDQLVGPLPVAGVFFVETKLDINK